MKIPSQEKTSLSEVFEEAGVFGEVDSNLQAWLHDDWEETNAIEVDQIELDAHKDNSELINGFGGEKLIQDKVLPIQIIKHLVTDGMLQTNGLSNLFFVYSKKENKVFIVGVVWDKTIDRFVPYIYRTRNLYRAWTKGNRVFIKR